MIPLAPADATPAAPTELPASGIEREAPPVMDAGVEALVKQWQSAVAKAKKYHKEAFDRMREDCDFVGGEQWIAGDKESYVANIVQRHVTQRVASLYAKDPTVIATRRQTLDFELWEGTVEELNEIMQALQMTGGNPLLLPPHISALIADIQEGVTRRRMLDKVARTLTIVYDHTLANQPTSFKVNMKALVRRACATGVGWVRIGFQRVLQRDPFDVERINGLTEAISTMERRLADKADGEIREEDPEMATLKSQLASLQAAEQQVAHEGVVFDFPLSTSIIVDPACRHLRTLTGAKWIAEEHNLTPDQIKEIYGKDLGSNASRDTGSDTHQSASRAAVEAATDGTAADEAKAGTICVWTVWDKTTMQTFTVATGYRDFLVAPHAPKVFLKRFWPVFPLIFNEVENPKKLYPDSDVRMLMHQQKEYNRSREGLRQHRIANRPKTAVAQGRLSADDIAKLECHPANAVIELQGLAPGEDVGKLLQPIRPPAIDGALYDTGPIFEDILRVGGQSDASIGAAQGGVTATGDSIAEQNRTVATASNSDDLDDLLNELANAAGNVLLSELRVETVKKLAGRGAVWPDISRQDIADNLLLGVEAGSSGRPNKAMEISNMERVIPLLLQIPGIKPDFLAKQLLTRLDDKLDPADALAAGLPSIIAMSAMAKTAPPAGPASDIPAAQGAQGSNNQETSAAPQPTGPPAPTMQGGFGGIFA